MLDHNAGHIMPTSKKIVFIIICVITTNTFCMEPDADDNLMGKSWIIINTAGKSMHAERPALSDLQKLCKAANTCTRTIHGQIELLFNHCKLPFNRAAPAEFVVRLHEASPIDALLRTLDLADSPKPLLLIVDDYDAHTMQKTQEQQEAPSEITYIATLDNASAVSLIPAAEQQSSKHSTLEQTATPVSTAWRFLAQKIRGSFAPFKSIIAATQQTQTSESVPVIEAVEKIEMQEPLQESNPEELNHRKYEKALTHGKELLKRITKEDEKTNELLVQLHAQLVALHKEVESNITALERDQICFATLRQCILTQDLTLTEEFLLTYAKMGQYSASVENTMADFFGRTNLKINDVTDEQFAAQWRAIQVAYENGSLASDLYYQLRQYSYILQTVPSRCIAQAFLDGTLDQYGLTKAQAQKIGLTDERIQDLIAELSNCKSFLLRLRKGFADSIKIIEKAL
ncbi:MAG: hypothetical protein AB7F19_04615 [Candidatus Babeliales bacterium]